MARDKLFIPHLEGRMLQPNPPEELRLTLLALHAADINVGYTGKSWTYSARWCLVPR
jgi:hypothetical protein